MRLGQVVATVGLLAEDETGRSLWDVDDGQFAAALERFAVGLARRGTDPAGQGRTPTDANGESGASLAESRADR